MVKETNQGQTPMAMGLAFLLLIHLKKWLLDRNLILQDFFKGFLMILRENRVGSYPFGNLQNLTVPILRVKQTF